MEESALEAELRQLQEWFRVAIERLEQRAREGDGAAQRRLAELGDDEVSAFVRLTGEGGGELCLRGGRAGLHRGPLDAAFGYAVQAPLPAARLALRHAARDGFELEVAAHALAALGTRTARGLFGKTHFAFELELTGVPDLGTVVLRLSVGRSSLAPKPEFRLVLDYEDALDARDEGIAPHQMFMAGKIKIDGDVAKAMVLAMTLAQLE